MKEFVESELQKETISSIINELYTSLADEEKEFIIECISEAVDDINILKSN